jgi:hypothetical protein
MVWTVLDGVLCRDDLTGETTVLIQGGADGADRLAWEWSVARLPSEDSLQFDADWSGSCRPSCRPNHRKPKRDGSDYCPAAGVYRNTDMLIEGNPELVVAFSEHPLSSGTANMVGQAKAAGLPVWVISHG